MKHLIRSAFAVCLIAAASLAVAGEARLVNGFNARTDLANWRAKRVTLALSQEGRTEVWEGQMQAGEIKALLAWIDDTGFFDLDDHYTVENAPTDHPSDCVRVNLSNVRKGVCEYYDGAPRAFDEVFGRLWNGAGLVDKQPYRPQTGWVLAETINWAYSGQIVAWPEGLALRPSGIGEGAWVEGETLAFLWENRLAQGPWMVFEQDGEKYGLVLQVPGLMPQAPDRP